jgi:ribosomal protein L11 methyltransferase
MDYLELRVSVPDTDPRRDRIIGFLSGEGFDGFLEETDAIVAYRAQDVIGLDQEGLRREIALRFSCECTFSGLKEQNWNALWEKDYQDVALGNELRVKAPFHLPAGKFRYEIEIEPKMSFGTAHHPTTRQMLAMLLKTEVKGLRVLDMGSGTAVLAILASMRGAAKVLAVDNDEWAWRNGQENVMRNPCSNVEVIMGDASAVEGMTFDVILANINRNILMRDIPVYTESLAPGGLLMLSGFYISDLPAIRKVAEACGLFLKEYTEAEDWVAASFRYADVKTPE